MLRLHSIHALPNGRNFRGRVEAGSSGYQFTFSPKTAAVVNRKLVLTGGVTIKSPTGRTRKADHVTATLLATQGSVASPPPVPRVIDPSLKPTIGAPAKAGTITEAAGDLGSVAVMYLKLSSLDGKTLGVPMEMSNVQLNARLYSTSEVERDLHWLYSALILSTLGEREDEKAASGYLAEINRILKS